MPILTHINTEELRYQLALWQTTGIGPVHYRQFMKHFQTAQAVFSCASFELKKLGCHPHTIQSIQQPDWRSVEKELDWLQQSPNHHVLTLSHHYPPALKQIHDPPPLLFVMGHPEILYQPQLAMVGSRNPSPTGSETAYHFARVFDRTGLRITSGLALGIDAASHRGALQESGQTIAVLGHGLGTIYPACHRKLACAIAEHGALISEFPLDSRPHKSNFPRRNRIISGLTLGTLVVEATLRSGSLITARLALEQGRDVFAIPGSIHNPLARGCHALLAQGAKLVETPDDVTEELAPQFTQNLWMAHDTKQRGWIVDLLEGWRVVV